MSEVVTINEVSLRDGLQNQARFVPTEQKLELFNALKDAGLRHFEATSFVTAKAVPQLADALTLFRALPQMPGLEYSVLIPNQRGWELALEAGARTIACVVATTETMNLKNIRMDLDRAIAEGLALIEKTRSAGLRACVYIATAFGCPYEGAVRPEIVLAMAARFFDAGAHEVIIADTIGTADPWRVAELFEHLQRVHDASSLSAHFHDTQGLALANSYAAFAVGIRRFDSSIGGLGGCPFAPGAAGNVATEDLVNMFDKHGCVTGVDSIKLLKAVEVARKCVDPSLQSRFASWRRLRTEEAGYCQQDLTSLSRLKAAGRNNGHE